MGIYVAPKYSPVVRVSYYVSILFLSYRFIIFLGCCCFYFTVYGKSI
jgi:hypothetical protein